MSGPKLRGKLRAVGADWVLLRPDGVIISTCALPWRPTTAH